LPSDLRLCVGRWLVEWRWHELGLGIHQGRDLVRRQFSSVPEWRIRLRRRLFSRRFGLPLRGLGGGFGNHLWQRLGR